MEISEQTLIDIVRNQGMQTQAFIDLKDRLDKTVPYIIEEQKELDKRIHKVEKRVWYGNGVAVGIAFLIGLFRH